MSKYPPPTSNLIYIPKSKVPKENRRPAEPAPPPLSPAAAAVEKFKQIQKEARSATELNEATLAADKELHALAHEASKNWRSGQDHFESKAEDIKQRHLAGFTSPDARAEFERRYPELFVPRQATLRVKLASAEAAHNRQILDDAATFYSDLAKNAESDFDGTHASQKFERFVRTAERGGLLRPEQASVMRQTFTTRLKGQTTEANRSLFAANSTLAGREQVGLSEEKAVTPRTELEGAEATDAQTNLTSKTNEDKANATGAPTSLVPPDATGNEPVKRPGFSRPLSDAEKSHFGHIFTAGNWDPAQVILLNNKQNPFQEEDTIITPDNNMYFNPESDHFKLDFADQPLAVRRRFVHELVHTWQAQNNFLTPGQEAVLNPHTWNISQEEDPESYKYELSEKLDWDDYNNEQQCEIVADYYVLMEGGALTGTKAAYTREDYERVLAGHIIEGRSK